MDKMHELSAREWLQACELTWLIKRYLVLIILDRLMPIVTATAATRWDRTAAGVDREIEATRAALRCMPPRDNPAAVVDAESPADCAQKPSLTAKERARSSAPGLQARDALSKLPIGTPQVNSITDNQ